MVFKENALNIAVRLGVVENFSPSDSCTDKFKRHHYWGYKTVSEESRSVSPSTVEWKTENLLKMIEGYDPMNFYNTHRLRYFRGFLLTGHWLPKLILTTVGKSW